MKSNNTLLIIGSDHAGYPLKEHIVKHFSKIININDIGTNSSDSVDYPDIAHQLASQVGTNSNSKGILICGSGVGVSIVANKHPNCRAALCWNKEIAKVARQHNNANICCLPARFIPKEDAIAIVQNFMESVFKEGRHTARVNKIDIYER